MCEKHDISIHHADGLTEEEKQALEYFIEKHKETLYLLGEN